MVLRIKLYGDLREKIPNIRIKSGTPITLNIKSDKIERVEDILGRFNIIEGEISHIFINNKYSGIGDRVKNGDRIGLFPKRMGIIFVEIKND
jgi:hypothetical protein